MKWLKYKLYAEINRGTEENPQIERILSPIAMEWNEQNEETAKREAYAGHYTIEDDGKPDPSLIPSQLDIIEAQVVYTAICTDTLLEEV